MARTQDRPSTVFPIRLDRRVVENLREAAARNGKTTNKYVGDLLTAAVGTSPVPTQGGDHAA